MGLFSALRPNKGIDEYGAIPVPGEAVVTLPAGKLRVSYAISSKAPVRTVGDDEEIMFEAPTGLTVQITGPDGEQFLNLTGLEVRGMRTTVMRGGYGTRQVMLKAEVTQPGEYTVKVGPALPGEDDPQILLGS